MRRPRSSASAGSPVARPPELTLGLRRLKHRLEQAGEALLELVAPEPADAPRTFVVLGDHAGKPQHLEVMARRRLAHGQLDRPAGARVQVGEAADDLEPD